MTGLGNNHADSLFFISFLLIGSLYHGRCRRQEFHVFYEKETIFLEQRFSSVLVVQRVVVVHGHLTQRVSSNALHNCVEPQNVLFICFLLTLKITKISLYLTKIFLFKITIQLDRRGVSLPFQHHFYLCCQS